MHSMEIVALQNKESITLNQVWLCCCYPDRLIAVYMTMGQNSSPPNSRTSIIWNSIQIDHCQKPSSWQYPWMNSSSCWKSLMFQLPHCSRPCHCLCPTRTSHASYVGHQHNIAYNLKGKPNSTCFQPWFFQLCLPQIGMPSTATNKLNHNLQLTPKTANAFCMNSTSMTKVSSIVTLDIHIWVNWKSPHKVLSKLLTYNNSLSMVPFSYSNHWLLLRASTFADCCHSFVHYSWGHECCTSVIMTSWPTHTSIHDITTKYPKPAELKNDSWLKIASDSLSKTFDLQPFFHETHLIHMTTSEESLRVLFFTHSFAIDLVHYTDMSRGPPQQIQAE
jgi:hypothetical protein